jgi:acetolactate synthase-1/2/3 large subunit
MPSSPSALRPRLAGHALVEALVAQGIETVFGVPNDMAYQLCSVIR